MIHQERTSKWSFPGLMWTHLEDVPVRMDIARVTQDHSRASPDGPSDHGLYVVFLTDVQVVSETLHLEIDQQYPIVSHSIGFLLKPTQK